MPRRGRNAFISVKREADLQSQCARYAIKEAYQQSKLEHKNGDTDTIITGVAIAPAVVFVEFKTEDKGSKPNALQKENIKKLRRRGYRAYIIDNYKDYKDLITFLDKHGVTKLWRRKIKR